jgi:uncharacterized protein YkwD
MDDKSRAISKVIRGTNVARARGGLEPLRKSDALQAAAMNYAETMAQENHFCHTGKDGSRALTRAQAFGYSPAAIAENIGRGYISSKAALQGWLHSEGHSNSIMGAYQHIGVGFAKDPFRPGYLWVQMLGRT